MWLELPNIWIAVINILGIPVCHLGIAWLSTCLPARMFQQQLAHTEQANGDWYDHVFHVRRWKKLLPDAAPWFRGFAKGKLKSTDSIYLTTFIGETRRGEFSHWLQIIAISLFILWTPYPASIIIVLYAIASNAPCIINLRYTRLRMVNLLHKKQTRTHAS